MKVMEIRGDWGLDNLKPGERPMPTPREHEVVVRMQAVSVNFRDVVMARRGYGRRSGELPLIPLSDGAGTVAEVGPEVTRVKVGDLVCPTFAQTWLGGPLREHHWSGMLGGPRDGTMQEYMLLPEDGVVKVPPHLDAIKAAALPCAALTAWNAIVASGAVAPGDVVLTQGTGGVSLFVLLFARMLGARVIITSSSDEKLARAKALGADETINYRTTPEWGRAARDMTGGRGVDVVVELAGAQSLEQSLRAVRVSGTLCLIGVLSGATANLNLGPVVTQGIRLQGVTIGSRDMFEDMMRAIALHRLEPPIEEARCPFEEIATVLKSLPEGRHFGKICVRL